MYDLWVRDTEIVVLIALSAILMVLPLQLLLCWKAKKLFVKLLPTILLGSAMFAFYISGIASRDWSAMIYAILAIASAVLLFFSGIGWVVFAVVNFFRKR